MENISAIAVKKTGRPERKYFRKLNDKEIATSFLICDTAKRYKRRVTARPPNATVVDFMKKNCATTVINTAGYKIKRRSIKMEASEKQTAKNMSAIIGKEKT